MFALQSTGGFVLGLSFDGLEFRIFFGGAPGFVRPAPSLFDAAALTFGITQIFFAAVGCRGGYSVARLCPAPSSTRYRGQDGHG